MKNCTFQLVQPSKIQISLRIIAVGWDSVMSIVHGSYIFNVKSEGSDQPAQVHAQDDLSLNSMHVL